MDTGIRLSFIFYFFSLYIVFWPEFCLDMNNVVTMDRLMTICVRAEVTTCG